MNVSPCISVIRSVYLCVCLSLSMNAQKFLGEDICTTFSVIGVV